MSTKKTREPELKPLMKITQIISKGMEKEVKAEVRPTR